MRGLLDHVEDQGSPAAELVQGKTEHDREQQHLQDLPFRERIDDRAGDHGEQELHGALHLARLGIGRDRLGVEGRGIDVHAGARPHDVDDHEPDDQSDRADDLEVDEREPSGLADLLHVLHAGDADHHGAEDDRRDDHLDELDEAVAERLHRRPGLGEEVAEQNAEDDGDDHLEVEALVEGLLLRGGCRGGRILCHVLLLT